MRQTTSKNDFYEIRPFLYIFIGAIGVGQAVLFQRENLWLFAIAMASAGILFFSSAKILQWRKEHRKQWL